MRVISGSAGGRNLKEPAGSSIRPTSGKVKESIFSIVQFDIEGRRVLDLFAGTGQLGIEALSRGARSVVFVDSATESVKLIRENLKICGFSEFAEVYPRDAIRHIECDGKFDLIFIDPPYDSKLAEMAVMKIIEFDKLNINGIMISESNSSISALEVPLPYMLKREYKYGGVKIAKYTREAF